MKAAIICGLTLAALFSTLPALAQSQKALLTAGDAAVGKKQWSKAVAFYSKALKRDPKNPTILYARAYAEYYLSKYADAEKDLRRVAALTPNNVSAKTLLGDALYADDRYTDAIAAYTDAIALQNDNGKKASLYQARANAESAVDLFSAAIGDYQQSLTLKPSDSTTLSLLANAYYSSGNDAETEKNLQAAILAAPNDSWSYRHLGIFRWLRHRYGESLDAFTKAISLAPKDSTLFENRGVVYASMGNLERALSDNAKAMTLDKSSEPYMNRGILYWIAGNTAGALSSFTTATRRGSDDALSDRGVLYLTLGRNGAAAEDLQTVVDRYAKKQYRNSTLSHILAIAYRRLHQNSRARSVLNGENIEPEGWPRPIRQYLLGQLSASALRASAQSDGERADAYTDIALQIAATGGTPSRSDLEWVTAHTDQLSWNLYLARSLLGGIR